MAIARPVAIDAAAGGPQRQRRTEKRNFLASRGMTVRSGEESSGSPLRPRRSRRSRPRPRSSKERPAWTARPASHEKGDVAEDGDLTQGRASSRRTERSCRAEKGTNTARFRNSNKPHGFGILVPIRGAYHLTAKKSRGVNPAERADKRCEMIPA